MAKLGQLLQEGSWGAGGGGEWFTARVAGTSRPCFRPSETPCLSSEKGKGLELEFQIFLARCTALGLTAQRGVRTPPADLPGFLFPASCQGRSLTSPHSDCQPRGRNIYGVSETLSRCLPVPTPHWLMEHLVSRTQGRYEVKGCRRRLLVGGGEPRPSWDSCV